MYNNETERRGGRPPDNNKNYQENDESWEHVILVKVKNQSDLNDPVKTSQALDESSLQKHGQQHTSTNKKRGFIVIKYKNKLPDSTLEEILCTKKIGNIEVSFQLAGKIGGTIGGVVYDVASDVDMDVVRKNIKPVASRMNIYSSDQENITIKEVIQLKKKGPNHGAKLSPIKITFEGEHLPYAVTIFQGFYRVHKEIKKPVQCFNCHKYGHSSSVCRAKVRCLFCSKNHSRQDCSVKNQPSEYKCSNCNQNHKSSDKNCKQYKVAEKVENLRAEEHKNLSFQQAWNMVTKKSQTNQKSNQNSRPGPSSANGNNSQRSYSQVTINSQADNLTQEVGRNIESIRAQTEAASPSSSLVEVGETQNNPIVAQTTKEVCSRPRGEKNEDTPSRVSDTAKLVETMIQKEMESTLNIILAKIKDTIIEVLDKHREQSPEETASLVEKSLKSNLQKKPSQATPAQTEKPQQTIQVQGTKRMLESSDSSSEQTSNVDSDEEPMGLEVKFTTVSDLENISDHEEVSPVGEHENDFQKVTSKTKKKHRKTKTKSKKLKNGRRD